MRDGWRRESNRPKRGGILRDLFRVSDARVDRLSPFIPKSRGKPRVDDRRRRSGVMFLFLSADQTADDIGARVLHTFIRQAGALLAGRCHDADLFRNALIKMRISPFIPSRSGRKAPIPHDADLCRLRDRIETIFAALKDWRPIASR